MQGVRGTPPGGPPVVLPLYLPPHRHSTQAVPQVPVPQALQSQGLVQAADGVVWGDGVRVLGWSELVVVVEIETGSRSRPMLVLLGLNPRPLVGVQGSCGGPGRGGGGGGRKRRVRRGGSVRGEVEYLILVVLERDEWTTGLGTGYLDPAWLPKFPPEHQGAGVGWRAPRDVLGPWEMSLGVGVAVEVRRRRYRNGGRELSIAMDLLDLFLLLLLLLPPYIVHQDITVNSASPSSSLLIGGGARGVAADLRLMRNHLGHLWIVCPLLGSSHSGYS